MTRWLALTTICDYLRAGLLGGGRPAEREITWELVIEVASFHFVTPTLARCLDASASVPPDVRAYFDSIAALNGERNQCMLAGLERVAGLLNEIDIEPVLLKGVSLLAGGLYREPAMRFLGDADILIPASRAAEADAALRAAGFCTKPSDVVPPPSHHHLPLLHDPDTGLGVELHTDIISQSPDAAIATAWFCERSRAALFRKRRVRLPEPTRNAGHIIFHSQLFHGLYSLNKIQLRHLLDLAVLRARYESAIDWSELDQRFSTANYGEVLATYLGFNETLLGQPAPKLRHAPRADAMAELRSAESRNSFQSQIERLKDSQDRLQTELSHMTGARESVQAEAERLAAELARAVTERGHLATVVARITAEREDLATAVIQITAERDGLAAALTRTAAERHNDQLALMAERDHAVATLGAAMRAAAQLQREVFRLQGSRSWRFTAPLRILVATWRRWLRG